MCPACIGSTLLLLGGAGSAGAVSALTLRTVLRRSDRSADGGSNRPEQSRDHVESTRVGVQPANSRPRP